MNVNITCHALTTEFLIYGTDVSILECSYTIKLVLKQPYIPLYILTLNETLNEIICSRVAI